MAWCCAARPKLHSSDQPERQPMTRKTAANLIVMIVAMFLMALILTPTLAHATGKPEPVTPAPTLSTSSATAAGQAKARSTCRWPTARRAGRAVLVALGASVGPVAAPQGAR